MRLMVVALCSLSFLRGIHSPDLPHQSIPNASSPRQESVIPLDDLAESLKQDIGQRINFS
jgi:hypothetical protein